MPTYEYACRDCGHQFESFQSIKADPLKDCPQCHHRALQRLIGTGAGILFKGTGFYETDYKRPAKKSENSASGAGSGGGGSGSSSSNGGGSSSSASGGASTAKPAS